MEYLGLIIGGTSLSMAIALKVWVARQRPKLHTLSEEEAAENLKPLTSSIIKKWSAEK